MNTTKKYRGVIVPVVTPFTPDYKLDEAAVEKLFGMFFRSNSHPFILGTTGEFASLSTEIKKAYIKKAATLRKENTILYGGISSNSFDESIELAQLSIDNGVDVLVANLPSYYGLTEGQMKKYFIDLVDRVKIPLIIYNIPSTTHMSIPLAVIDELSYHPNIVGVKDSERNEVRLVQSLTLWKNRNDFSHFLGWAARSVSAIMSGGDGVVPGTGNLMPEIYSTMLKAIEEGNHDAANEMQQLSDAYGKLYQEGKTLGESLRALKVLMEAKGLCGATVMPPLQPLVSEEEIRLKQRFEELNEKYKVKFV